VTDSVLAVEGLCVSYGRRGLALDKVSLQVPKGGIVALLGANGAGKSTLIRTVTGLLPAHNGRVVQGAVRYEGQVVTGVASHRLVRMGMAQVPEGRLIFKQLTVEENLQVGATAVPRREVAGRMEQIYALFPRLLERRRQAAGWLSGGEQQMLALGRALIGRPRLLLVDELSLGLAPIIVDTIYNRLMSVGETLGTAMLIVEQNAHLALEFAHTAYVLERGRMVVSGPASVVAASSAIAESYLGLKEGAAA
jgi:branched-chain amino acid transport system ATP-binding protein